jgi:excisionase family DNA binding protein
LLGLFRRCDMLSFKQEGFPMRRHHSDPIIPSDQDAMLAKAARLALERSEALDEALHLQVNAAGHEVATLDLPPVVTRLLMDVLKETAAGNAVTLVPVEAEITTQQAADLLNVSRPFLVGLIDNGILLARMVGKHRRLPLRDVLAYKADQSAKREKALDEIVAIDQELGLL